jgi:superfamily I DNA and/or RNA helicase
MERALGVTDILVVSPYNMQVNLLQPLLPAGARVGTVDKFQGQEAAVVIVSMTTSSAEDMPVLIISP